MPRRRRGWGRCWPRAATAAEVHAVGRPFLRASVACIARQRSRREWPPRRQENGGSSLDQLPGAGADSFVPNLSLAHLPSLSPLRAVAGQAQVLHEGISSVVLYLRRGGLADVDMAPHLPIGPESPVARWGYA